MGKLFMPDSVLAKAIGKLAGVIIISLLWIIGCLGVVTIGTSTTAAYYVARKARAGETNYVKNYLRSFRENFRQSLCLEMICIIPAVSLAGGAYILLAVQGDIPVGISCAYGVLLYLAIAYISYLFPLLAFFDFTNKILLKNALLIAVANTGRTFLLVLLHVLPLLLAMLSPMWVVKLLPLIVALLPGTIICIGSRIYETIFIQYVQPET